MSPETITDPGINSLRESRLLEADDLLLVSKDGERRARSEKLQDFMDHERSTHEHWQSVSREFRTGVAAH